LLWQIFLPLPSATRLLELLSSRDFGGLAFCSSLIYLTIFQVGENFVPPLLDAVLIDYQRNVPAAREPEVLSTMATIVNKLGGHITSEIPQIFDAVFECTLNMINKVRPTDRLIVNIQVCFSSSWDG